MLGWIQFLEIQGLIHLDIWQCHVFIFLGGLRRSLQEAVKLDDSPPGAQLVVAVGHHNRRTQEFGICHLTGNKLAPDQVVELLCVFFQAGNIRWPASNIRRANGFVSFLSAFLAAVDPRLLRQITFAELLLDELSTADYGILAEIGGIRTHVGNKTGLVQSLGQHHGFLDAETHAVTGRLLQRRGNKGCRRTGSGRLVFALDHLEAASLEPLNVLLALSLVDRAVGLVVITADFEPDRVFGALGRKVCMQLPEFFRHKLPDLPLPLHNQSHGDGLHTPRRQAPGNLCPQQRRNHITHNTVQEPAGLLRIHPVVIQIARILEGFLNRPLGDLVKHYTTIFVRLAANGLLKVPGNRLPFSIQIRCQIDMVSRLGQTLELADHLFLAGQNLVTGAPVMIGIDTHTGYQLLAGLTLLVLGFLFRAHLARGRCLFRPFFRV